MNEIVMNETQMSQYICDTFDGVDVVINSYKDYFFFYNPDPNVPPDHMYPFVTIVTSDTDDQFSNLNRPDVFRLNIGLSKQTFNSLFNLSAQTANDETTDQNNNSPYDFTAINQLMPHPVYGQMHWVCVLNPSSPTFETKVQPLLAEAYHMAVSRYNRQHPH